MISYADAVQVILAIYIVTGLGFMCGGAKTFGVKEASAIRRIVYTIAMPALLFRQIGRRKLTLEDWHPFLNEVLVQVTVHLLFAAFCFAIPFKDKRLTYLQSLFACTYTNFIFFGYPIVNLLFGEDRTFIPCMMNIVQFVFVIPFHTFLIYRVPEVDVSESQHGDEEESGEIELQENGEEIGEEQDGESPLEHAEQPTASEESSTPEESAPEAQEARSARWKMVLWTIVTPLNVCVVLGIVWSATVWEFPMFIDQFLVTLEKAVMGAGLFSIGVLMWEHPFTRFNVPIVLLYMVLHFVAIPLISALWAWAVGMDTYMAKICTFSHTMPPALVGYIMAVNCGYGMKTASFTFFWSNMVCIVVLMVWVAVFNEAGLFDEDAL